MKNFYLVRAGDLFAFAMINIAIGALVMWWIR